MSEPNYEELIDLEAAINSGQFTIPPEDLAILFEDVDVEVDIPEE
jgi:hypothetical protein